MRSAAAHGAVLYYRIYTIPKDPFLYWDDAEKKWIGFSIDMLNSLREEMEFEYEIHVVKDLKYGDIHKDGSWDGLVGELLAKRADVVVATLQVTADREKVIDFTVPYFDLAGISAVVKKHRETSSLWKFLIVMELGAWPYLICAYLLTTVLFYTFDRLSPYSYQNNKEYYKCDEGRRTFDVRESLWFCLTSLTPQGAGEMPKNLSGQIIAATWWLFGFVIITSYTANLSGFLTVSRLTQHIHSFTDLTNQNAVGYSTIRDSVEHIYFQRMSRIEHIFWELVFKIQLILFRR